MKVLFIYASEFSYKTGDVSGNEKNDASFEDSFQNVQTAFIHVEKKDQETPDNGKTITRLIKQTKWIAKKNNTKKILLHSFAHLADTKADPEFAKHLFNRAQERLEHVGYIVNQTPFGYFLDLELKAPGRSLARVFFEI